MTKLPAKDDQVSWARIHAAYLLAFVLLFHLACNIWWLWRDDHPIGADAAFHMQFAEKYYQALFSPQFQGWQARWDALKDIHSMYPPLFHILGAVFWVFSFENMDVVVFCNTIVLLGLILGVYYFARTFMEPGDAAFAAIVASLTPAIYGLSRLYFQDLLAAMFVVWGYWALAKTRGFTRTRWVLIFAVLCGLGFLTRWTVFLYYAGAAVYVVIAGLVQALRRNTDGLRDTKAFGSIVLNLFLVTVLPAVILAPWYANNYATMMTKYRSVFAGKQGNLDYSSAIAWGYYPVYIINTGTFLPLFLVGMLGIPAAFSRRWRSVPATMSVLWVVSTYVILTLLWNFKAPAPRYILPLLPAFGVLTVFAISLLPGKALPSLARGLVIAVLLFSFGNLTFASYGRLAKLEVRSPYTVPNPFQRTYTRGLVVYSDTVYASAAKYFAPFRGINWIKRSFDAMLAREERTHYLSSPTAGYQLLRLSKVGTERLQKRLWPKTNPLQRHSYRAKEYPSSLADIRTRDGGVSWSWQVDGKPAGDSNEAPPALAPGHTVEARFPTPQRIAAFELTFSDEGGVPQSLTAEYVDGTTGEKKPFTPPVGYAGGQGPVIYLQFDPVSVRAVRFSIEGTTEVAFTSVRWFDRAPQPRPLVALGSGDTIEEIGPQMAVTDYLIAADLTQEERTTLDPYFEVIDQFTAHLTTHWQECEVTVLAIRQPSAITFGTDERLRVAVSGGRSNVGNVTLPWWRFPEMDTVLNPELERPYWAAELPVVAEVDFGRSYRLTALEVVPFRRETAPSSVSLDIWDADTERWIRLGPAYPVTVWPKYNEQGFYEVRPMIRPWPNPVVTTRVRLLFEGSGQPRQTTAIANVFAYGDRAPE